MKAVEKVERLVENLSANLRSLNVSWLDRDQNDKEASSVYKVTRKNIQRMSAPSRGRAVRSLWRQPWLILGLKTACRKAFSATKGPSPSSRSDQRVS